jgi:hypothetical protein
MLPFSHYEKRIFEEMLLRRLPGPKREGITRERRKLQNEELHFVYPSSNIIRVINSKRL